jgi:hypothetical protein
MATVPSADMLNLRLAGMNLGNHDQTLIFIIYIYTLFIREGDILLFMLLPR